MQTLVIEHPGIFAAAAAFSMNLQVGVTDPATSPTPLLIMVGTDDPWLPTEGGDLPFDQGTVTSYEATVDYFVSSNSANPVPIESTLPDLDPTDQCLITSEFYASTGGDSAPVQFYLMNGSGHAYATRTKWNFFETVIYSYIYGPPCYDAEAADLAWGVMSQFS